MGYKRKEYENMESLFTNGKKKFVKYEEGAAMYSMGIHAFTELAKEAKAIYRIRRIVLVNTEIIDEYIENFRVTEAERDRLFAYCKKMNLTQAQVFKEALELLYKTKP